jgi:hypothetical protein
MSNSSVHGHIHGINASFSQTLVTHLLYTDVNVSVKTSEMSNSSVHGHIHVINASFSQTPVTHLLYPDVNVSGKTSEMSNSSVHGHIHGRSAPDSYNAGGVEENLNTG